MITKKKEYHNPIKSRYKAFKVPLKSILNPINASILLPKIEELTLRLNDLTIHTYQFIRLYCLYCFHSGIQIEINVKFVRYSIRVLGECKKTKDHKDKELLEKLEWFYQSEYQPTTNHIKTDLTDLNPITTNMADQILTCIKNNCQERFIQHFKRFVNKTCSNFSFADQAIFKRQILACDYSNINPIFQHWMATYFQQIFPFQINTSVHYHVKADPLIFLRSMFYMSMILENMGLKTFHCTPLRTEIVPCNFKLDTTSLATYFVYYPPNIKTQLKAQYIKEQKFIWSHFLNLKHKIFRTTQYTFYYEIQTDGISCSLLFIRKDLVGTPENSNEKQEFIFPTIESLSYQDLDYIKENRNIVGCDPGKSNLVYMIDSNKNTLQYKAYQRRFESKHEKNEKHTMFLKNKYGIHHVEYHLSNYNARTVNYNKFKDYIRMKVQVNYMTKNFYNNKVFRKMKLRSYIEGKRSEDKFVDSIGKKFGENCVLAYGDWSETEQMKRFIPTKGVGLRKLIHRKYLTLTTREAYTSQRCNECFQKVRYYKNDKTNMNVLRLLVCENCVKSLTSKCVSPEDKRVVFRSRDKNGATNIMNIAKFYLNYKQHHPCFNHNNLFTSSLGTFRILESSQG